MTKLARLRSKGPLSVSTGRLRSVPIVCSRSVLPSRVKRVAVGYVQLAVVGYTYGCARVYKNNLTATNPTETVCNTPLHC